MENRTRLEQFLAIATVFVFTTIFSGSIVYGQHLPPSDSISSHTTPISAKLKAEMCAPSNPSLKVVNTTESRICGIPKTVKNTTATVAARASSSEPASFAIAKQQQLGNKNSNNVVSRSNSAIIPTTTSAIGESTNKSLYSASTIAPQVNSINKQFQHPVATNNGTAGHNYTFATTTPASAASSKLMYIGYHDSSTPSNSDSSSKNIDSSDAKSSTGHSSSSSSSGSGGGGDSSSKNKDSSDAKETKSTSDLNTHEHKNSKGENSGGSADKIEGILKEVL